MKETQFPPTDLIVSEEAWFHVEFPVFRATKASFHDWLIAEIAYDWPAPPYYDEDFALRSLDVGEGKYALREVCSEDKDGFTWLVVDGEYIHSDTEPAISLGSPITFAIAESEWGCLYVFATCSMPAARSYFDRLIDRASAGALWRIVWTGSPSLPSLPSEF